MGKGGFSWKRALGVSKAKSKIAKATGIPTTKAGRKRKRNSIIAKLLGFKQYDTIDPVRKELSLRGVVKKGQTIFSFYGIILMYEGQRLTYNLQSSFYKKGS